jgi:hypothetical protein
MALKENGTADTERLLVQNNKQRNLIVVEVRPQGFYFIFYFIFGVISWQNRAGH